MLKNILRSNSRILFQFEEKSCLVLKWQPGLGAKRRIQSFFTFEYASLEEKNQIAVKVNDALKKLDYAKEPLFLAISHQLVSSSYIRLPSQDPGEIKEMIHLQAAKDLPFTPEELVFGYQVIETDKEGFSSINMIFSRKEMINFLVEIFRKVKVEVEAVYLATYGLIEAFNSVRADVQQEVMVVNFKDAGFEAAVLKKGKVYLSRFATISRLEVDWKEKVFKQIMDTNSLYLRQGPFGPIKKVFLMGPLELLQECKLILDDKMLVPVEVVVTPDNFPNIIDESAVGKIPPGLLGFILKQPVDSLSLLPKEYREIFDKSQESRRRFSLLSKAIAAVIFLFLGFLFYTGNKKSYLDYLDKQIRDLGARTGKLEVKVKELSVFRSKRKAGLELIEFFAAIHKAIPSGMLISGIRYNSEETEALVLKGYSEKLETVFIYASALRDQETFLSGEIKVKQASSRPVKDGEVVNFEISFLRKK
ncbi:MAG: hypothetical protein NTY14_03325 [Candidatus Omnitrophica bacterium]|nr:hypothetical protein [Candidatus Omnitrophota bacterium]